MQKDIVYFRIAEINFRLVFQKTEFKNSKKIVKKIILKYLQDFLLKGKPLIIDQTILFIWEKEPKFLEIKKEKESYINYYRTKDKKTIICFYRISIFEFELLLRRLLLVLLKKDKGIMIHASGVRYKNGAYLFLGNSGAGKSTIVHLLKGKSLPFADDGCIIKQVKGQYCAYQTPFFEKGPLIPKRPYGLPLIKVFLLRKAKECKIQSIQNKEILFHKLIIDSDVSKNFLRSQITALSFFIKEYKNFYILFFNKSRESIRRFIMD